MENAIESAVKDSHALLPSAEKVAGTSMRTSAPQRTATSSTSKLPVSALHIVSAIGRMVLEVSQVSWEKSISARLCEIEEKLSGACPLSLTSYKLRRPKVPIRLPM